MVKKISHYCDTQLGFVCLVCNLCFYYYVRFLQIFVSVYFVCDLLICCIYDNMFTTMKYICICLTRFCEQNSLTIQAAIGLPIVRN